MYDLLGESTGKLNAVRLRALLSDQSICACDATLFDTTTREALVTRGPTGLRPRKRFGFEKVE